MPMRSLTTGPYIAPGGAIHAGKTSHAIRGLGLRAGDISTTFWCPGSGRTGLETEFKPVTSSITSTQWNLNKNSGPKLSWASWSVIRCVRARRDASWRHGSLVFGALPHLALCLSSLVWLWFLSFRIKLKSSVQHRTGFHGRSWESLNLFGC